MEKIDRLTGKFSIKTRLIKNFMLIIIVTVVVLLALIISGVRHYYYRNIEDILSNQLDFSVDYLVKYLDIKDLDSIVIDDIDLFWNQTTAQIQLYNSEGRLLLDSLGVDFYEEKLTPDLEKALGSSKGVWIGNTEYYKDRVISVSKPIIKDGRLLGVLRFTSSMKETNDLVMNISLFLSFLGLLVILISVFFSYFLANSIVKPIKEVTKMAEKMAGGQLDLKIKVDSRDEIGKLSDTLNYMSQEILKKDEIKNEFISSISHELKTPLTSIKGWAITLQDEEFTDYNLVKEGLDIIEVESDRLSAMLEELLDFSRFVSGGISLRKKPMSLRSSLMSIEKQILALANLEGISLNFRLHPNLDNIIADEDRIKQVLINLLDNALKFSSPKSLISLVAYREEDMAIIIIEDQGIGISKEDLPRVREKFYKGDHSRSNRGIGLSIVDEIIELHKGSMKIESKLGVGTKVTLEIPVGGGR